MKIYMLEPGKDLRSLIIPHDDLPLLQQLVGGYIEIVSFDGSHGNTVLIVDEEGKLKGKEPCMVWRGDILVGTVLFVGLDRRGELCDCPMTEDEIQERIERRRIAWAG